MNWLTESLKKIWEGFLQNIGVFLLALLLSGGYLTVITIFERAQEYIRNIPTGYVMTPLVFLTILLWVVLQLNYRLRKTLTALESRTKPEKSIKLTEIELATLKLLFDNNKAFQIEEVASFNNLDPNTAKYHVNNLLKIGFIYDNLRIGGPTTFNISNKGISYIVENEKLFNKIKGDATL